MVNNVEKILTQAIEFEKTATNSLIAEAKKKLDPKAKVRNRGTVCVPAESAKDKKDHFPINNEAQARNALARVNQFSKVPEWYSGSLQGLVSLVARKVHSKYPGIKVSKDAKKPGKKKASEYYDTLLQKFGQVKDPAYADNLTKSHIQSIQAINIKQWSPEQVTQQANEHTLQAQREFDSKLITQEQYQQIVRAVQAKGQEAQTASQTQAAPAQNAPTAAKPTAPVRKSLPVREDVRAAQNQLYRANEDFAQRLEQAGGVDGKLGRVTIQLLREYLPRMDAESAVKYLAEEEKKDMAPKKEPEQLPPNPYNANSTWGV